MAMDANNNIIRNIDYQFRLQEIFKISLGRVENL